MKVDKRIVITEEIEVKFTGITLLSKEEYEANKDIIPPINGWWWLRSPGSSQNYAAIVSTDGSFHSDNVSFDFAVVRPALIIWNSLFWGLFPGSKFELAGYIWTVLPGDLALCDSDIGQTCFRKDWQAEDANDFDKSDIKQWLYYWAERHGIEFMMQTFSPD